MAGIWQGSNLSGLYTHNRSVVLDVLRRFGPMTVADISQRIGLKDASVGSIIKDLQAIGFVEAAGTRKSSGGRPPTLYRVGAGNQLALAADLSGSEVNVGAVDLHGRVLYRDAIPVESVDSGVFDALVRGLRGLIEKARLDSVLGVGVAMPGLPDFETGHVPLSVPLHWSDFPLAQKLSGIFSCPVSVGKETDAAILAEYYYGDRGRSRNFLLINIGIGVGVAMILNGSPYRGTHDAAGEWGHTVVIPDGPMCWCGNRGCLEEVASLRALARRAAGLGATHDERNPQRDPPAEDPTARADWVLENAAMGNRACLEAIDETATLLGRALFNLVQLFDPEVVVIDVSAADEGGLLYEAVRRNLNTYRPAAFDSRLEVRRSPLGGKARLIGAGMWVFDKAMESLKSMLTSE